MADRLHPRLLEYPYTPPPVTVGSVTSAFNKTTKTVQLVGTPFGSLNDYIWSVVIYNSEGTKIWESPIVKGVEKTFFVPSNILELGASYKYSVVAQLLDRIPGYPAFLVRSKKIRYHSVNGFSCCCLLPRKALNSKCAFCTVC